MLELRPEVAAFAQLMEAKLRQHDDRPGWKDSHPLILLARLQEETGELAQVLISDVLPLPVKLRQIAAEAADVANFCMMLADVAQQLPPATGPDGRG